LKKAGLEPHRQTFDTLVPETKKCVLNINGTDVEVFALGPNGPACNTTGGKELTGPLVWLGNGDIEDMKGKPVEGCIAVLNFDTPNMEQVFSQGALAVIFVGNGKETRFQVRNKFFEIPVEIPRLFVYEETARKHKLMTWQPDRKATVSITTVWKDVEGINLWLEIPGEEGAKFNLDEEEAVILSATMDTFGVIPERSQDLRNAANCALLVKVAKELAKNPQKRSTFIVFFGSHYAMQDGARIFYYAVRNGLLYGDLTERTEKYKNQMTKLSSKIELLEQDSIFEGDHPDLFEIVQSLDKRLEAKVSVFNIELGTKNQELRDLKRTEINGKKKSEEELEKDAEKIVTINARLKVVREKRSKLNNMRRELNDYDIKDTETFNTVATAEREWLKREIDDSKRLLTHNETYIEIAKRFKSKRIIGHYGFDFANAVDAWTLTINGLGAQMFYHSNNLKGALVNIGDFVKNLRDLKVMETSQDYGNNNEGPSLFTKPVDALLKPDRFCTPYIRSVSTRVAHANQIFGYQMMTVANPLNSDEMPYPHKTDLEPLAPKIIAFCRGLGNAPELSQPCPLAKLRFADNTLINPGGTGSLRFLNYVRSSEEVEGVPRDGIANCTPQRSQNYPYIAGNSYAITSRILASGHIFMPFIFSNGPVRPFGFSESGSLDQFPVGSFSWHPNRLFYGYGGTFFTPLNIGKYGVPRVQFLGGTSNSRLTDVCSLAFPEGIIFYNDDDKKFKTYATGGILLLGNSEEDPLGKGISMYDPPIYSFNVLRQTAHDYQILNESRLNILRKKAIINDSLESLHADATEHWENAVEARKANDIPSAIAHEAFSSSISARVSVPLREITNDMIQAVVVLLLLSIPFAFAMERLVFSAVTIYRQVVGFAVFFVGTFILLYFTHPAFTLATSPLIIFLAFVIILLSVMVMFIVMGKFKRELRAIQGLSTSAHGVASDSSTSLAAVLIGISGMRNRPLKTFLISLTIIMLTFTIVVFASFTPMIGVKNTYMGKGTGESRIELRRFTGLDLPSTIFESVKALYGKDWKIFTRKSLSRAPNIKTESNLVLFNKQKSEWITMDAMLAFDPLELNENKTLNEAIPGLKDWASKNSDAKGKNYPPLFLHPSIAKSMKLTAGETVSINGKKFIFAGAFNSSVFDEMTYLDKAKLTPPDFEVSKSDMGEEGSVEAMEQQMETFVDATRFTYLPSRSVGITVLDGVADLTSFDLSVFNSAILMYPPSEGADVESVATEIAKFFTGPVLANGAKGVNKFFFSAAIQASGFSMLIVPLLLGGLIIFNSLLGSIVDRQKEIFTYSALGLSPPDVGALFFAESGVYAVLGGMGGYLLSQVASKVVYMCGERGWFVPPEMNFSSLSSVLTILIVMAMVIISTIYPAIKAGRSANPGLARKWKMPKPEGNKIEFIFPFTVSANDMTGILAFIREHFANHGDSSLGSFAAAKVKMYLKNSMDTDGDGEEEDFCGLRANISLAPFDLGVMQEFEMYAQNSEIEGIDEVVVSLTKVSGTTAAWLRGNKSFVNDLREQFLFWRSLPIETVEFYRTKGEELTHNKQSKKTG